MRSVPTNTSSAPEASSRSRTITCTPSAAVPAVVVASVRPATADTPIAPAAAAPAPALSNWRRVTASVGGMRLLLIETHPEELTHKPFIGHAVRDRLPGVAGHQLVVGKDDRPGGQFRRTDGHELSDRGGVR